MRVVAGRYGGRTLKAPRGRDVRPTADRVREALFSILGPLDGLRVLDLFAGTGALGIEALSRGAASCVFVDVDTRPVARNLRGAGNRGRGASRAGAERAEAGRSIRSRPSRSAIPRRRAAGT